MGLSVIGAGFGRTGTISLKMALEQLGLGPCHHMEEVFDNPNQVPAWKAAIDGEGADWDAIYDGYNSTADWPGAHFARELADYFPDAKIILTARPVDSWWESYSKTIMKFLVEFPEGLPPHIDTMANAVIRMLGERTFKSAVDDEQAAKSAYLEHVEHMTTSYAEGRVLSFDVKDGWAPLCEFLGKPVPDGDFPRSNNSEEFWVNFGPDR
jgi:hypothetical protein